MGRTANEKVIRCFQIDKQNEVAICEVCNLVKGMDLEKCKKKITKGIFN